MRRSSRAWLAAVLANGLWAVTLSPTTAAQPAGAPAWYLGDFAVTYYWIATEDDRFDRLRRDQVLRDPDGRLLARVSRAFRAELDREGSGRLADGRILNVARRDADGWRYRELAAGAWGESALGRPLEPFVTVAADPRQVPPGARLLVPALGCLEVAGATHDGVFSADDRGSAIAGARLDVFIGERRHLGAAERAVPSHATTAVFLLPEPPEPAPEPAP